MSVSEVVGSLSDENMGGGGFSRSINGAESLGDGSDIVGLVEGGLSPFSALASETGSWW